MMLRLAVPPVMPMVRVLQVMLWFMVALVMPMVRVLPVEVLVVGLCVAWVVIGRVWRGPSPISEEGLAGGVAGWFARPVGQMMASVP